MFTKYKEVLEIIISSVLMILLISKDQLFDQFSFFTVIYTLLAFIIILELVRMVMEYIVTHHISIRIVIDTFIIFTLRESILIYSDKSIPIEGKVIYIILGFLMILSLFYFRKLSIINSPFDKCSKCELKIENELRRNLI